MNMLKRIVALLVIVMLSSAAVARADSVGQDGNNLGNDKLRPAAMCDISGCRKPDSVSMTEQGRNAINRVVEETNSGSMKVLPGKDDVKELAGLRPDNGQRQLDLDVKVISPIEMITSGQYKDVVGQHIVTQQISGIGQPRSNVGVYYPPAIPLQYQMRPRRCR